MWYKLGNFYFTSCTTKICFLSLWFDEKPVWQILHVNVQQFIFLMNWFKMSLNVTFLWEIKATNVAFEWFLFLMNWIKMSLWFDFLVTFVVTNFTSEWFLFHMNWFKMSFQETFSVAAVLTNFTFESLFFSWNDSWCIFKVAFWEQL